MMKRGILFAAALAATACGGPQFRGGKDGPPVLEVTGRVDGAPLKVAQGDLAHLPRRTIHAHDPRGGPDAKFEGLSVQAFFLDSVSLQRGADVLVVHGRDGYEVAVPMGAVRVHRPILADKVDGAPIRGDAAPLVLAWPNVDQPGLDFDPRARWWWVDGVRRVEVLSWNQSYGRALRVPAGAPDEARTGADAYATSCMQCHRLRGAGGSRGPDLTKELASVKAWDHFADAVRAHAARPDAAPIAELPATTIRHVASFLNAVAVSDPTAPPDEPPPPEPPAEAPLYPGAPTPPHVHGATR